MSVCMVGTKVGVIANDGNVLAVKNTLDEALAELNRLLDTNNN